MGILRVLEVRGQDRRLPIRRNIKTHHRVELVVGEGVLLNGTACPAYLQDFMRNIMTSVLPPPAQVAGKYAPLYEAFYRQLDPSGKGIITAPDGAKFLKKSGLSDAILSKIWDLSDPTGKGYLDKSGLFVSLKLVSLAQNGGEVDIKSVLSETPEPQMDADKDGALDLTEFVTCMGLLGKALGENGRVPNSLPQIPVITSSAPSSVLPPPTPPLIAGPPLPTLPATILPPKPLPPVGAVPPVPVLPPVNQNMNIIQVDWIVSPEELAKYTVLFTATDKDRDGYVSGLEIRDVFLQSGIPQPTLAHIWNLCDTDQTGKLSLEQFALAMYFINKKLAGFEPPAALLPHMIPPSLRSGGLGAGQQSAPSDTNPEFELISKEIKELAFEKEAIENEIAAKETEKKIKSGEMRSLQTELDTLAATLKQLENQKGVAGAKLGELAAQVDTLKTQADSQEESLSVQEGEVNEKLREYNGLNEEEASIEVGMKESQETIDKLALTLQETQLAIVQAKAKISSLTELKETMENLASKFAEVIENGNVYSITEPELMDLAGELSELIGEPEPEVNANNNFVNATEDPFASSVESQFVSSSIPVASGFEVAFMPQQEEDPFAALHAPPPLSASSPWSQPDPFAPVAGGGSIKHDFSPGKDPFGHEPFSLPEESPALPPKKAGKAPPPRPAPPKNAPARPPPPKIQSAPPPQQPQAFGDPFGQGDPFGGSAGDGGDFADFSQFDQQFNAAVSTSTFGSSSPWGTSPTSSRNTGRSSASDSFSLGTKTLDFTEDPFKNYRYEDPFALADPFQSLAGDPFSQQQQSNSHFDCRLAERNRIHQISSKIVRTMSQLGAEKLNLVKDVDIDPQGRFKYVLVKVYIDDPASKEDTYKYVVRGYADCPFHADVYDRLSATLRKIGGLDSECVGGGRILHENKKITVFGYSQGYGRADHNISVNVLKKFYTDYDISWNNDGY
ncbi:unnamed protein product [Allacma fusca]|uniref:Uncharacterized protein n=2 Tax=Allacma fusca TaxID=39272 RepID=A0A8J2JYA9_9HEXA|nr:unnamed protein product [Allacma fusca]